ncbi:MAG: histidine phosphatase family protein [Candidatus Nanoarchaeia archaeon]|nr:histidine phosphatase family protein [Candidatus Nanoarchaeia archaeon]
MVYYHIYLFRHGETYFNRYKIFTGWKDSRLTFKGIKQAKIIAEQLKGKKFQVAFQTTLSRSKDTLKYVLKSHPECKKIITDDRLIERRYGRLEGKFHKTVIRKYGQQQFDIWHRAYDIHPPGGESFKDVEKRIKPFIEDLTKYIKKNKVNVAISAHGNSIRLFRKIMEDASVKETVKWFIPYDKVFVYKIKV